MLAWTGHNDLATIDQQQMRNTRRNLANARRNQQHAERSLHQSIQNDSKMFAGRSIEAVEWLVQYQQPERQTKGSGQLNSLCFSVGEREKRATEKWPHVEQGNRAPESALEREF